MNHFIEIGREKLGRPAIVIHSGSRKSGWLVGQHYMKLTKTEDKDLPDGFFHLNSDIGQAYIKDMNFFLEYALANRLYMMKEIVSILGYKECYLSQMINENHNHAIVQEDGMVLHRKGATPADKSQLGVIPGNMRDGTFITKGLGNEEYLSSASHGAGRTMSRTKAKATIDFDSFQKEMKDSGIISRVDAAILDEAPQAYKDVNMVIGLQEGIVINVIDRITPIINVKG